LFFNFQDFDPKFHLKDVTLVISNSNENVAYNINKLLKDMDNIATNNVVKDKCETGIIIVLYNIEFKNNINIVFIVNLLFDF